MALYYTPLYYSPLSKCHIYAKRGSLSSPTNKVVSYTNLVSHLAIVIHQNNCKLFIIWIFFLYFDNKVKMNVMDYYYY